MCSKSSCTALNTVLRTKYIILFNIIKYKRYFVGPDTATAVLHVPGEGGETTTRKASNNKQDKQTYRKKIKFTKINSKHVVDANTPRDVYLLDEIDEKTHLECTNIKR